MLNNKTKSNTLSLPSNRNFGYTFIGFFLLLMAMKIHAGNYAGMRYLLLTSGMLGIVTILVPKALSPLNILWAKFGALLHAIVTPIIMGILFFVVITPMGIIMRVCGWDPLRLRFDTQNTSYWLPKQDNGMDSSMHNQF